MTDRLTPEERAEARALCDAATEGPWLTKDPGDFDNWSVKAPPDGMPGIAYIAENIQQGHDDGEADARFIAAAWTLVPRLLDDLDAVEAERDRYRHLLGSHADGHRCTCTMTRPADYLAMTPPEWEQDPWCPTHPDVDYILAERDALRERLYQVEAEYDSNVAAGRLHAMNMQVGRDE